MQINAVFSKPKMKIESSRAPLDRNYPEMLPTKHNWSNVQVFANSEWEMNFFMPDVAATTASNKSESTISQSAMIELMLKHPKFTKNHQSLLVMPPKRDYQKKPK